MSEAILSRSDVEKNFNPLLFTAGAGLESAKGNPRDLAILESDISLFPRIPLLCSKYLTK